MNATSRPWKRKGERADGFADIVSNNGRIVIASFWGSDPIAYANCTTTLKAVNTFDQAKALLKAIVAVKTMKFHPESDIGEMDYLTEYIDQAEAILAAMEAGEEG